MILSLMLFNQFSNCFNINQNILLQEYKALGKRYYKVGCYMLQSRMLQRQTRLATAFYATCYNFFCSMLHATLSNMVINWCSILQNTFDLCLNRARMCIDLWNTLKMLCVQLNMADTNMSGGESYCDEKH